MVESIRIHVEVLKHRRNLPPFHLLSKLISLSSFIMAKWGRNFFHKFREKVKQHKVMLDELVNREDDDGVQLYIDEKEKLHDLLIHEEIYRK